MINHGRPTDLSTGTREINKFVRNPQKKPTCHTIRIELAKGHVCWFKDLFVLRAQNSERENSVSSRRQSIRGGGGGRGVGAEAVAQAAVIIIIHRT